MIELVPLRQKHIFEMVGATSPYPFVGLAGLEGGSVVGCGGLVFQDGLWVAGLHLRAQDRGKHALSLMRATRKVVTAAKALRLGKVVAFCDPEVPKARAFLERIGFAPSEEKLFDQPCWVLEA